MALTPLDNQSAVRDDTSVLAATTFQEKATVLEQLLVAHPELVEEAEGVAGAVLMSTTADAIADDVADRFGSLGCRWSSTESSQRSAPGWTRTSP